MRHKVAVTQRPVQRILTQRHQLRKYPCSTVNGKSKNDNKTTANHNKHNKQQTEKPQSLSMVQPNFWHQNPRRTNCRHCCRNIGSPLRKRPEGTL